MKQIIEQKIKNAFDIASLEVIDESHKHAGHLGGNEIETHFLVRLTSDDFKDLSRIERQKKIYNLFTDELKSGRIHMLSLNIKSTTEK